MLFFFLFIFWCKTRRESSPSSTSWENVRRRTSDHQEDMIKDGGNEVLFNDQITKRRTTWSGFDSHALPHAQTHQSMREDWVAKNAKQPAPKPEDLSVSSNNLVKDGARRSNTFLRWRKLLLKFP
ncbi:uncharacterized protein [Malus domestica]|uniref:uncharacterized protein n=1 Tax=Malus domestica TaxID=3750 RepID=UPI0010A9EE0A|nr:uncharacterized protein LOC103449977 [Malus domestica]